MLVYGFRCFCSSLYPDLLLVLHVWALLLMEDSTSVCAAAYQAAQAGTRATCTECQQAGGLCAASCSGAAKRREQGQGKAGSETC